MLRKALCFLFCAGLLSTGCAWGSATKPKKTAVGEVVLDFAVKNMDGKDLKLSDLRRSAQAGASRPVVLVFWCTTCASCRSMEGALAKLAESYKDKAAVFALAVNRGETAQTVQAFLEKHELALPVVLETTGTSVDLLGVACTTTTVVLDGQGVLRYRGRFTLGQVASTENALKAVLEGKAVERAETAESG